MEVSSDFWATTAQVLPTLLLAYVVERRWRSEPGDPEPSGPRSLGPIFVSGLVGLALGGEFLALRGLLGNGGTLSARLVVLSIALLAWVILGPPLIGYATESLPNGEEISAAPLRSAFLGSAAMLLTLVAAFLPLALGIWLAVSL